MACVRVQVSKSRERVNAYKELVRQLKEEAASAVESALAAERSTHGDATSDLQTTVQALRLECDALRCQLSEVGFRRTRLFPVTSRVFTDSRALFPAHR